MFRNSLKMLLGSRSRKLNNDDSSIDSDTSDIRMMKGFTRSLPSSPLLNLRLDKRNAMYSVEGRALDHKEPSDGSRYSKISRSAGS